VLGGNDMGIILILIGLFFIYMSTTMWFFMYMEHERKLKMLDYIIGFIPIVRTIYMMIEIKVDE
jgi:hypothetical protein